MEEGISIRKLNLLFITHDRTQQVEKSSYYLSQELAKQARCVTWNEGGNLQEIVNQISFMPDFILLNDMHPDYCPFLTGVGDVNIPVGIIMHDLHYKKGRRRRFIKKENIRYIFSVYRDAFLEWYPEFNDRMIWFPHHVPDHIFKDYGFSPSINWLMTGSLISHLYPLRNKMRAGMSKKPGFVYVPHPGYRKVKERGTHAIVGKNYAQTLNRSKIVLTCDSIYHFPVLKYFEVAACNRLLLASESRELNDLGFINGETFVAVNENNFMEKAEYYLHHEKERLAIAQKGHEMVHGRHTTRKRVSELLNHIEKILEGK